MQDELKSRYVDVLTIRY